MNLQKVLFFLLSIGGSTLLAAPSGGNVIQGKADFHVAKQGLQIKAADQTVIQWQDFSIGKGEFVKFVQPHSDATVVNRVISDQLSEIYGSLKANGHVYLINPAGIVVGAEGLIQAAGFIASTFDFTKSKEGMVFKGDSKAIIVNEGQIETPNGDVFLIGYQVVNEGEIHGKTVGLAGGSEVLLKPAGSERLFVKAEQRIPTSGTAVENKGTIEALKTELKGDGNAFSYAIKNDGLIEATRLYEENGEIFLLSEGGVVSHGGTLIAEGGEVRLLGHTVELKEGSLIDVSHDTKPGDVFIGGNQKGFPIARFTYVDQDAKIHADARILGNGGTVIFYANDCTEYHGFTSALGGELGGNGGFVEVSGRFGLGFAGLVDTRALNGVNGMLYIDPTDITISGAANSPTVMYPGGPGTVTFTAAATPVNLLNTSVVANLALGNLTIDTNAPITSAAAGTITVTSAVNWSNANSLTLNGDSDVNLFNTVFNTGAAGTGALTVLSRTGDVNISAAVSNIPVLIGSQNGAVSVQSTCGDVNITAGNTASDHATIGSFTGNSFGPITVVAGRDLNMQGGIGTLGGNSSSAVIGRMGLNQPGSCRGDITVTVGRNATLIGGSTTGPGTVGGSSQIGHALGFLGGTDFHDGAIFFNVGGNLEMLAGLDGAAVIGNGIDNNGTVDNDIFINVGGHMYMHDPGGTGFVGATIGGFNFDGGWRQNIFLNVGLNLTMDARNGGFVTFQAFNNFGDFATEGIQRIHVGGDFTLIGGDNSGSSSQCYVLLHQPRMWTEVYAGGNIRCYNGTGENAIIGLPFAFNNNGDLGRLDIRAGGNLIMGGGPAKPTPGNDQVFNSQTQFVYLEADASFVSGQLWPAQSVINPCSGVNIFAGTPLAASSGNQSTTNPGIIGGDGLGGFAIDTGEYNFANATTISGPTWSTSSPTAPAAPVAGPNLGLSYSAETGLSILSSDRFADGAPCDFLIGATNTPNAMQLLCRNGDLTVDQFRNITIQPTANPFSPQNPTTVFSGDVLIIANNDIYMDPQSRITSANNLTLVCDNQAPVAPQIGGVWSAAGRFIMDATASLVSNTSGTGGELRVYTALQAANSILGTLNGALFFAGIRFFDTDIEQWCTYYPGGTPGSVFKIYYKPCEQIPPLAQIPIAELFFDLHGPDEYLGWPEEFKYQFYDVNEKGLWALFNHLPDEGYFIRRKFYYMNNPKSSRDFIELYTQTTSKVVRVYEKR